MPKPPVPPPECPPEPTPFLFTATLHRVVVDLLAAAMAGARTSPGDYALLSIVQLEPGVTITAIAARLAVPLATVSDHVRELTGRGLLSRTAHDSDRRRQGIMLTEAGQAAHAEAMESFGRAYVAYLERCSTPPQAQVAMLQEMIAAARGAGEGLREGRVRVHSLDR